MTMEIFEKHPTADAYKVGAAYTEYCILAKEKRFSDAELAAEYWQATFDYETYVPYVNDPAGARLKHIAGVVERFATLPHFDA